MYFLRVLLQSSIWKTKLWNITCRHACTYSHTPYVCEHLNIDNDQTFHVVVVPAVCADTGKFQCDNFTCIGQSLVCDGTSNCPGGEDETDCAVADLTDFQGMCQLDMIVWLCHCSNYLLCQFDSIPVSLYSLKYSYMYVYIYIYIYIYDVF